MRLKTNANRRIMNQQVSVLEKPEFQALLEDHLRLGVCLGRGDVAKAAEICVRLLASPSIATNTARFIDKEISMSKAFGNRLVQCGAVRALVALVSDLDNLCEASVFLLQTLFELCSLTWPIVAPALVPLVAVVRKYGFSPEYPLDADPDEYERPEIFHCACETLAHVCQYASIPAV